MASRLQQQNPILFCAGGNDDPDRLLTYGWLQSFFPREVELRLFIIYLTNLSSLRLCCSSICCTEFVIRQSPSEEQKC